MDAAKSLHILCSLGEGVDPQTGEVFPADSPYQHPDTVRALFAAIQALEKQEQHQKREQYLPANAGKPWDKGEDDQLCADFDQGMTIKQLSQRHGRTQGAIQSRLMKLGKLMPEGFSSPA